MTVKYILELPQSQTFIHNKIIYSLSAYTFYNENDKTIKTKYKI